MASSVPAESLRERTSTEAPGRLAILGAGVMGTGLAQAFAFSNYSITLIDASPAALERSRKEVCTGLRFLGLWGKKLDRPLESVMKSITFTADLGALETAETVIENVTENWEIKHDLHLKARELYSDGTLMAINTSVISITRIAKFTREPENTIGIHFMNPVPLSSAAEVVRGEHTSPTTLGRATDLLRSIGKEAIVVNDLPGFVSNRVLMLTINEAIWTVQDQVAQPEDVDRIFTTCFGHKMGPLETGDLIGLDTILYSLEELYASYQDPKFRACPLLRRMVDAGRCGRKTGAGFYSYNAS